MRSKQSNLFSFSNVIILVSSLIALYIFLKLSILLLNDEVGMFDERGYFLIRQYASPIIDKLMLSATFLGDTIFVIFPIFGLFIYYTFISPHKWYAIITLVNSIGCTTINTLLKLWYGRERPLQEHIVEVTNLSFPSGHAMFSVAFYGLLIYLIAKGRLSTVIKASCILFLVTLILLIGISRVYLGVHYTSDVVAGFAAGYIWLIAVLVVMDWLRRKIGKENRQLQL